MKYLHFSLTVFALILFLITTVCSAEDYIIKQQDLKFEVPIKVVAPGDRIIFSNEDSVVHNITSNSDQNKFDLGSLAPGTKKSVEFPEKGVVDIDSTIHPNTKMTVFVF